MRYITAYFTFLNEILEEIIDSFESDVARGFLVAALILTPIFSTLLFFVALVNASGYEKTAPSESFERERVPAGHTTQYSPTEHRKTRTVTWVSNRIEVGRELQEHFELTGVKAIGLADIKGTDCTVYAYEPSAEYNERSFEVLSHEITHCFRGKYHD